ncbi:MAG TPA: SPOR domain-containing protein [Burkholderiales bacterium]
MPRAVSDDEIELRKQARRRLVGAIVLVTVAVMILPMVLDQEPTPVTQEIAISIPPKGDAASFAPKAVPVAEPPRAAVKPPVPKPAPAAKPGESAADAPKAGIEADKGRAETPKVEKPAGTPPAKTAEAAPAPEARAKPEAASGARSESYVVQLDAFSNPQNAQQQKKKLSAAGIPSYTETAKTPKGELTRVRVGPYSSREQAEQMRDRLAKLGVKSVVVPR